MVHYTDDQDLQSFLRLPSAPFHRKCASEWPDLFVRAFVQTNSAIEKENVQLLGVWRFNPPFGSFQIAYQRGTSEFGERSEQSDTLFSKLVWVL